MCAAYIPGAVVVVARCVKKKAADVDFFEHDNKTAANIDGLFITF